MNSWTLLRMHVTDPVHPDDGGSTRTMPPEPSARRRCVIVSGCRAGMRAGRWLGRPQSERRMADRTIIRAGRNRHFVGSLNSSSARKSYRAIPLFFACSRPASMLKRVFHSLARCGVCATTPRVRVGRVLPHDAARRSSRVGSQGTQETKSEYMRRRVEHQLRRCSCRQPVP